jgi:hypothetical protein
MKITGHAGEESVIRVRTIGDDEPRQFEVAVQDRRGESLRQVTMSKVDIKRLAPGTVTPGECIRAAFLFLLDREPRESILRRFDVSVIEYYFPDFTREFPRYLNERPSSQDKS